METKITLELKDNNANVSYEPALEAESFTLHINNALNTIPNALLNMFATVPILRPACAKEHEVHAYIFNEGERGAMENNLYKYRKHLYDTTAAIFSSLLSTAFPDIEYIEGCKQYQQEFCITHDELDTAEYTKQIEEVTAYVRENFEEVIKEVTEEGEQEDEQEIGSEQEN